MKFTGERMIPESNFGSKMYLEHINRYFFAKQFVQGKNVLDIACGSGYGSEILSAAGAEKVVGVDISSETVEYCKKKYTNIDFIVGDVCNIPVGDKSMDVIVSFETLEHVNEHAQLRFMKEVNRVLSDDGVFVLSTPNALVYEKTNEFHVKELNPDELDVLLTQNGFKYEIFFQESIDSNYIFSAHEIDDGAIGNRSITYFSNEQKRKAFDARYLIVVCTKAIANSCSEISSSIYVSNIRSVRHPNYKCPCSRLKNFMLRLLHINK